MSMKHYMGFVVEVAGVVSFCTTMNRAIHMGRLLCGIYKKETFTITLTSTGDTATFSKDTIVHAPQKVASPKE
jgi:hypothetical protein